MFLAGTWLGLTQSVHVIHVFLAAWAMALLALLSLLFPAYSETRENPTPGVIRSLPIFLAILFTGWSAAAIRFEHSSECTIASLCNGGSTNFEITGVVADDPAVTPASDTNRVIWQFMLRPETARQPSNGPSGIARSQVLVRLHTWADRSPPAYGEKWQLSGRIRQDISGRRTFTGRFFLTANSAMSFRISAGQGNPFVKWCYGQRRIIAGYLTAGIADFHEQANLLRALILGYRQDLPPDVKSNFAWTGTLHIIAISGSHIVVVCGILIFVLQALGVSRLHWGLFLGPLLVTYTVAIGMPASAVRATVMAIIYFSAPLLRRKGDALSSLALAAVIILAVDPGQLFNLGFILSFVCVLGLIIFCPLISRPLLKLLEPDPLRLQPEKQWMTALRSAGRHMVTLFALAVSGWLISTPLSAYYFGRFSIISLPANMLIVPLSELILASGFLSIVLGPCFLLFADIFNHANLALVTVMLKSMEFLAHIPYGSVEMRWPLWAMLLWYMVLSLAALWLYSRQTDRGNDQDHTAP